MLIRFGVLGPVTAEDADGRPIPLKGPMHRAVLGRLLVARGRVVPVTDLVDDLWVSPPAKAIATVRTFVAALRRAVEPDRPPRAPARLLVSRGSGYALAATPDQVDAWRFEQVVGATATLAALDRALGWWRGPAYADFPDAAWPRAERSRLTELRLRAVELRAETLLDLGRPADAVPDLDEHVTAHPWREPGWRLLALALYRAGRQGDALAVLRRARELLAGQLGVEPGAELRALEIDVLRQEPRLDHLSESVFTHAATAYERLVPSGSRGRLESAVGLLRNLAVTGPDGLEVAREQRAAAVRAAEQLGDPELTARVIGAYDVPAIWTRADDPAQSAEIVAAAERALAVLPAAGHDAARVRLLATIAVESRGTRDPRPGECARRAEAIARDLDDPALLAFALNGTFMQSCHRTGNSAGRDAIGAELVALSARHGLVTAEILGHLIRLQAASATGRFDDGDRHAAAADRLAERHELPLATVFTEWYRALRADLTGAVSDDPYRTAAERLDGAGMPGVRAGLLPLARLGRRLRLGLPVLYEDAWGPYAMWARLVTRPGETVLADVPDPPADLLAEALWCLFARAATLAGDRVAMARARAALAPAAAEWAGAASGLLTVGRVADYLAAM
ncbi:BTAD domain-containing putative transcriptional regulator [Actinoplanes sp. L3-i22]|uniref:AfsR/SARP family transcriptional regulator n=1 Tax=Actinoplanes sp. L3-i22 TaxID=2836373 RepID=UPI001C748712|nr:BTAD domain-containing putative transcriptional regulator [Actinoplanes sp. L3-i22]BCY08358.1 SARP family transcriptional regulator [Actinoplanes sp. L3-i22]